MYPPPSHPVTRRLTQRPRSSDRALATSPPSSGPQVRAATSWCRSRRHSEAEPPPSVGLLRRGRRLAPWARPRRLRRPRDSRRPRWRHHRHHDRFHRPVWWPRHRLPCRRQRTHPSSAHQIPRRAELGTGRSPLVPRHRRTRPRPQINWRHPRTNRRRRHLPPVGRPWQRRRWRPPAQRPSSTTACATTSSST
jgi:hypothetical protein